MPRASHRILITGAALMAVAAPLAASTTAQADYLGPLGRPGLGAGSLSGPWGIAAAPDGRIYVSETGRGQVSVFDSAGGFQRAFGSLAGASGIAVGPGGVYVAERTGNRVARFSTDGTALGTFGSKGVANGQFETPESVAIQGGTVLVSSQYRFQRFTSAGVFIDGHGGAGAGAGDFEGLRNIATGADGSVFTTETTNHRVQRFSDNFAPQLQWGEKGALDGQLSYPSGITVDSPTGSVWVTDLATGKVQRFGTGGQFRDVINPGPASAPDHLVAPSDVAVDCRGTVYVVDTAAEQVQRYGTPETATAGNLLRNGGFEDGGAACDSTPAAAGAGPGWSTGGGAASAVHYGATGGFPGRDAGDAGGGQSFLAGGTTAKVVKDQTIDVSAQALDIDDGRRLAQLSGRLGGYLSQEDAATVTATYRDGAGTALATTTIGPVTAADRGGKTELLPRQASATVPKGTRSITVSVALTRAGGAGYNDGYADQLALTLTPQRPDTAPGTTGQTPGGAGTPSADQGPRITLSALTTARAARTGRLVLKAGCDRRCALKLSGRVRGRSAGSATVAASSAPRTVTLRLSRAARRSLRSAIKAGGKASITLTAVATADRGTRSTLTRVLTVRG